ncbi:MAG: serine protease [Verrucomicrobiota bacterium]
MPGITASAQMGWRASPINTFIVGLPAEGSETVSLPAESVWPIEYEKPDSVYLRVTIDGQERIVQVPKTLSNTSSGQVRGTNFKTAHQLNLDASTQYTVFRKTKSYPVLRRSGGKLDIKMPAVSPVESCQLPEKFFNLTAVIGSEDKPEHTSHSTSLEAETRRVEALKQALADPEIKIADKPKDFVCLIEGPEGVGTGFLMREGGNVYCYTCFHVIDGMRLPKIRLINGAEIEPLSLEISEERDIARMLVAGNPPALAGFRAPKIGENIRVYGNSQGAGRVTLLKGEVTGIGVNEVETDAGFTSGNSGSALIADSDSMVVGVASYVEELADKEDLTVRGTRFTTPRRVGEALDDDIKWIAVDFDRFYSANRKFHEYSAFLRESIAVLERVSQSPQVPVSDLGIRDTSLKRWIRNRNRWVKELASVDHSYIDTYAEYETALTNNIREVANQQAYFRRLCELRESQMKSLQPYPGTSFQDELCDRIIFEYEMVGFLNDYILEVLRASLQGGN